MYSVSLATIKRARASGGLQAKNIGGANRPSWRISVEALATWFASLED